MPLEDDQKILEALKSNFQHARHIEDLRLRMALGYIVATFGAGFVGIKGDAIELQITGCLAGFLLTMFCWGMTLKWNIEFANQIQRADACAKALKISAECGLDARNMHALMGFPRPNRPSVRFWFHLFYLAYAAAWIIVLIIVILNFSN